MKPEIVKLWVAVLAMIVLGGCASSAPPLPPSLELPAPVKDLRAARKGDKVYLTWTLPTQTTDRQTIRHPGPTAICRSADPVISQCGTPLAQIPPSASIPKSVPRNNAHQPNAAESYVDNLSALPAATPTGSRSANEAEVAYAVEVLNQYGRSAGLSNQVRVPSLPAIPPPQDFRTEVTPEGVRIRWACPPDLPPSSGDVRYLLRIFRRLEGSQADDKIAEPNLMDCQTAALDQTFDWEKTYEYRAAAVTVIAQPGNPPIEIEGEDTPSIKVLAHDVFPPAVPSGLQAVFSGEGQPLFIDLIWSPDSDADLAGYNIYRREESGHPVKLNSELVKAPAYRDNDVQSGKKYLYSVSAVDVRANESARSEEASEQVP